MSHNINNKPQKGVLSYLSGFCGRVDTNMDNISVDEERSDIGEAVHNSAVALKNAGAAVGAKVMSTGAAVGSTISSATQATVDSVKSAGQRVGDAAHAAGVKIGETAHAAGAKINETAHAAADLGKSAVHSAGNVAHAAGAKINETAHAAADLGKSAVHSAGNVAHAAGAKINETAHAAADLGKSAVHSAGNVAHAAGAKISDVSHDIASKAKTVAKSANEKLDSLGKSSWDSNIVSDTLKNTHVDIPNIAKAAAPVATTSSSTSSSVGKSYSPELNALHAESSEIPKKNYYSHQDFDKQKEHKTIHPKTNTQNINKTNIDSHAVPTVAQAKPAVESHAAPAWSRPTADSHAAPAFAPTKPAAAADVSHAAPAFAQTKPAVESHAAPAWSRPTADSHAAPVFAPTKPAAAADVSHAAGISHAAPSKPTASLGKSEKVELKTSGLNTSTMVEKSPSADIRRFESEGGLIPGTLPTARLAHSPHGPPVALPDGELDIGPHSSVKDMKEASGTNFVPEKAAPKAQTDKNKSKTLEV